MDSIDKIVAEENLKKLFIGSQLDGVKFGVGPGAVLAYFVHYSNQEPDLLWINIEVMKMTVISSSETREGFQGKGVKELNDEEALNLLVENRREKVINVQLGNDSPHLFITFESGKTLCINGDDDNYECWQAGDGYGYTGENWLLIAVPGNDLSF
ncbi:hypothetical protein Plano_1012 [Planococcus sp. PAMC 21323]|uniref:hypothetical protein n=1 Tax=Planococcus sp. PAMC 21323 TaxID=1526927 RepID=UPI0005716BAB|nr:hypothetical protein [Planococcus sp. PAMC 21323]AIY04977.1 hypothetical protein Plano_1012 [Planococcus sp. PAMC 21323]